MKLENQNRNSNISRGGVIEKLRASEKLLGIPEYCRIMGVTPRTVYNQMFNGRFPVPYFKHGKLVKILPEDLADYLSS